MAKQFDGDGFDRGEFSSEEKAELRHLFRVMDQNFLPINEETLATMNDAATLVKGVKIIGSLIKVGGPVAIAGLGLGAFAKMQGWI